MFMPGNFPKEMAYWPQPQQYQQPPSPQQQMSLFAPPPQPYGAQIGQHYYPGLNPAFVSQQVSLNNNAQLQQQLYYTHAPQQMMQQQPQFFSQPPPPRLPQWSQLQQVPQPPPPQTMMPSPRSQMPQTSYQQAPQPQQPSSLTMNNKPPRSNNSYQPGKQVTVPHPGNFQQNAAVYYPSPIPTQPSPQQPTVEMFISPTESFQAPLAPGVNMIIQEPQGMMMMGYPPPVAAKRERKPLPIIDPKTGKQVNPASERSDSGYPSEASTPNSANCPPMPNVSSQNNVGSISAVPAVSARSNTFSPPQDLIIVNSASGTITPASSTADQTPPFHAPEREEEAEKTIIPSPEPNVLVPTEFVKDEVMESEQDIPPAIMPVEEPITAEPVLSRDESQAEDTSDGDDVPIQMFIVSSAEEAPAEAEAEPCSDIENNQPDIAVEAPTIAPPPQKTEVGSFFASILMTPVVKSTTPPIAPSPPIVQVEHCENRLIEMAKQQEAGPVMKRNYSRSDLLGLRNNSFPRIPSIPKDIAVEMPPMKRMFQAKSPADEICRELRGTLNKMTDENFDPMTKRIFELLSNDKDDRMRNVDDKGKLFYDCIGIIFDKAISEPKLAATYAKMFTYLNKIQFIDKDNNTFTFRRVMLNYCQREFELQDRRAARQRELEQTLEQAVTHAEKKDASENIQEFQNVQKAKYLGNIRLISELYKIRQLSFTIITGCAKRLLNDPTEAALESLCKLLQDIGQQLEEEINAYKQSDKSLSLWWRQDCIGALYKVLDDKVNTTSRIRFFIRDVLEARANGWQFKPKT